MSALTVTTPGYLVASIPYLMGFMPEDSHVIVWLNDDNSVGLVQRTNLVDASDPDITTAGVLHGFTSAICITFAMTRPEHFSDLHYDIAEALEESGVDVKDLMHYSKGRYWSYFTPKEDMIADPGVEIDEETLLTVQSRFALNGMAAVDSRQALIDEVKPADTSATRYGSAKGYWTRTRNEIGVVAARYEALQLAEAVNEDPFADEQDMLRVAASLEDINVRDAIVYYLAMMDLDELRDTYKCIASICRVTPEKKAATILSVAAVCAYLIGNGASANVCVDMSLNIDPKQTFAQLIAGLLGKGVHPATFRELITGIDVIDVLNKE